MVHTFLDGCQASYEDWNTEKESSVSNECFFFLFNYLIKAGIKVALTVTVHIQFATHCKKEMFQVIFSNHFPIIPSTHIFSVHIKLLINSLYLCSVDDTVNAPMLWDRIKAWWENNRTILTHKEIFHLNCQCIGRLGDRWEGWVTCTPPPFLNNYSHGLGQKNFWIVNNDLQEWIEIPG